MSALSKAAAVLLLGTAALALASCKETGGRKAGEATCNSASTPFCSSTVKLPAGYQGPRFVLSQDYPKTAPADSMPWQSFDPMTQPDGYANAVLGYFYEGNLRDDMATSFQPKLNTVRDWYHAPWLDIGSNGREPIHGLTRERASMPHELDPRQDQIWNNWAVGFYNAPGGVMFGKIWADHGKPDAAMAIAPEGTVTAKLLFTTAPLDQVSWLRGAPEWNAYIFTDLHNPGNIPPKAPRAIQKVRLLQIDFAVKDQRSSATGWVFGTFVYNGGPTGSAGSGWQHVKPVGVMWGNDPSYTGSGPLEQSWINPEVALPHLGYQGRLNGPVDNPKSSCLSCHMTAQSPESVADLVTNLFPPTPADIPRWFVNLPSGQPFTPGKVSNDYSMQVAFGLANFASVDTALNHPDPAVRKSAAIAILKANSAPPRAGPQ
ncbi:MAG: hypothetical protein Q8R44_04660 [Novosphingobium sp.]|nr:hypothetical protein [Novosphingobium sp.]